ncbi:NAD(P)H-hydrate dehydratase [Labilibacter sediminis]|nr:NAD(P)H-hydrate dehydratase [Labilibacter sediminis]
MKILSPHQIRAVDQFTIDNEPISSIDLMERAAQKATEWISSHLKADKFCIFAGIGNNGGDGLVIARLLKNLNKNIKVYFLKFSDKVSPDAQTNLHKLSDISPESLNIVSDIGDINFSNIEKEAVIIDTIFGSGLNRPTEGLCKEVIEEINTLSNKVVAIDIPSGLMANYNKDYKHETGIVEADYTLTFQIPKLSFMFPENTLYIGECHLINIGLMKEGIDKHQTEEFYIEKDKIRSFKKTRNKFSHKGHFGHALLIAGSYGKMGAAILASKACLKSGVGLLTTHIPHWGYQIIQTAVPEAMTSIDRSEMIFTEFPDLKNFNAIGIGPGIDTKRNSFLALKELLNQISDQKLVIDADGLNLLSESKELITELPNDAILTPHPKEFERLAGSWGNDAERLNLLKEFCQQNKVITVLKGAHTTIALPNGECYFNSTGNPGMATAGSGDALTGIILALLAQNYSPKEAAIMGVYIHGLAGDIALETETEETIIASDIISKLGQAFKSIN